MKNELPAQLEAYIGGLILGQGRFAGQPFPLQAWERKFLRGLSLNRVMLHFPWPEGQEKRHFAQPLPALRSMLAVHWSNLWPRLSWLPVPSIKG